MGEDDVIDSDDYGDVENNDGDEGGEREEEAGGIDDDGVDTDDNVYVSGLWQ